MKELFIFAFGLLLLLVVCVIAYGRLFVFTYNVTILDVEFTVGRLGEYTKILCYFQT